MLAKIDAFSAAKGRCAASIEELGMSREEFTDKLGAGANYGCGNGEQWFYYHGTYGPFEKHIYDFQKRRWGHMAD